MCRERRENRRHVHMTLMICREDDRTLEIFQMLQPLHVDPREHARKRKQKHRLADGAHPADWPRSIPSRKIHGLGDRFARSRSGGELLEVGDGGRIRKRRLIDGGAQRLFERHHHFDSLERAQPEFLHRDAWPDRTARRISRQHGLDGMPALFR